MDKASLIKHYYRCLVDSTKVAKQISQTFDHIRACSLKLDYSELQPHNEKLTALISELESFHSQREELAAKLGFKGARFSRQIIDATSGNTQQAIKKASFILQDLLTQCQTKLTLHSDLLLEQQNVIAEASKSLRVEVNA